MKRRERASWVGMELEPSLESKRRTSLATSRVLGGLVWIAAAGVGFFLTFCYLSASQ